MSNVADDRYLWSRALLAALSVVFLGAATTVSDFR